MGLSERLQTFLRDPDFRDTVVSRQRVPARDAVTGGGVAVARGSTLAWPMAFDGYQVEIPWDQIAEYEPILATHSNGAPMPIGKLGPAMIVFPETDDAELAATFEALQVYSLFYIGVE